MAGRFRIDLVADRYKGWQAWHLRRGPLEMMLVPQVGGRIMGLRWHGRDLLFTQPEREGTVDDVRRVTDVRAHKQRIGFPLWGGDKTWLAPQDRWTDRVPFLDLDSGPYGLEVVRQRADAVSIRMTSRRCRETGVRIVRTVTVRADHPEWQVAHRLRNESDDVVEWGVWGVSMVRRPGIAFLPTRPNSRHPGGVKTFASEGASVEARARVVRRHGAVAAITCRDPIVFKFGVDGAPGWALGIVEAGSGGLVGYRRRFTVYENRPYGHGCSAEVFNAREYPYLEIEIHGPVVRLEPDEEFELRERQAVFDVPRSPTSEAEVLHLLHNVQRAERATAI